MTSRKGNSKKQGQKHQNAASFRNDLHGLNSKLKAVNSLQISNVCIRCKDIIEWKIKFKKYKPRTCPGKCLNCGQRNVAYAYHTRCTDCAQAQKICAKCGEQKEIILQPESDDRQQQMERTQLENGLKEMSLRERRTFLRQLEKGELSKETLSLINNTELDDGSDLIDSGEESDDAVP